MKKTVSFFILNSSGRPARQLTLSVGVIRMFVLCILGLMAYAGYVGYDYHRLSRSTVDTDLLRSQLTTQQEEIASQHRQIQQFGEEINRLKTHLIALNSFEKKIRVIANIEKPAGPDSLFGVGGPVPDDIDTRLPVEEHHDHLMREMHDQSGQLEMAADRQGKHFESLLKHLEEQVNLLACTPAIQPASGWETSGFGYRTSPFTGLREFHKGVDFAAPEGTPVKAAADGIVTFNGRRGLLGNTLVIDHGYGMVTRYGHCEKLLKKVGDFVRRGDIIATIGCTGRSTGPHLHYEVQLNGLPVNPEQYILN